MEDDPSLPLTRSALMPRLNPQMLISRGTSELFPGARHPQAALAGLLLKEGCWAESHEVAQEINDSDGSYWHAILHRIEPDSANAAYWFRLVGKHPIFPALLKAVKQLESLPSGWRLEEEWNPYRFNDWCDEARRTGGRAQEVAEAIQTIEWHLLFDWCRKTQAT